jgi:hypothetical protein
LELFAPASTVALQTHHSLARHPHPLPDHQSHQILRLALVRPQAVPSALGQMKMNIYGFTKREVKALIIAACIAVIFIFIPQEVLDGWEILYLFIVVFPIGIYIATDPERIDKP